MTGRSPQATGVYNFIDNFREPGFGADWVALPQFFKQHGWYTAGGGKLYVTNTECHNSNPLLVNQYQTDRLPVWAL